jgi:Zn-dependent protease
MRNPFTNGASEGAVSSGPLSSGLRLGRIAGVEVRLHWSWAIIAAILTIVLAGRVFPAEVAGLSGGAYVAMGLVTAVLFFATLLLHELGHALQARHEGLPTRGITLWMLGGVARSGAPFPSPGAEARVAIAGPVVSAVLGAALVGAGHIGGLPFAIAAVLEWLGWTNVALLAFNMLPALPLDGGRVLRAVLWQLTASLRKGTHAATRVSQALSVALIVLGLAGFLVSAGFGGLWLAFIGWFVYSAATAERDAADAQVALAGVHVADVMTPQPITISPMATAGDLLALRRRTGHSAYPVLGEHGDALGLVSVLAAERVSEHRRESVTVSTLAAESPRPLAVGADADVLSAVPELVRDPLHRAAVLRAGRLVGLVTMSDVSRAVSLRTAGN